MNGLRWASCVQKSQSSQTSNVSSKALPPHRVKGKTARHGWAGSWFSVTDAVEPLVDGANRLSGGIGHAHAGVATQRPRTRPAFRAGAADAWAWSSRRPGTAAIIACRVERGVAGVRAHQRRAAVVDEPQGEAPTALGSALCVPPALTTTISTPSRLWDAMESLYRAVLVVHAAHENRHQGRDAGAGRARPRTLPQQGRGHGRELKGRVRAALPCPTARFAAYTGAGGAWRRCRPGMPRLPADRKFTPHVFRARIASPVSLFTRKGGAARAVVAVSFRPDLAVLSAAPDSPGASGRSAGGGQRLASDAQRSAQGLGGRGGGDSLALDTNLGIAAAQNRGIAWRGARGQCAAGSTRTACRRRTWWRGFCRRSKRAASRSARGGGVGPRLVGPALAGEHALVRALCWWACTGLIRWRAPGRPMRRIFVASGA